MKFANGKQGLRRAIVILLSLTVMIFSAGFMGCKSDDGDDSPGTVTKYMYKLNYDSTYHRVNEFVCIPGDNNSYTVKSVICHYFIITDYPTTVTGEALVSVVKNRSLTPNSKKTGTPQGEAKTLTTTDGASYTIPSGLSSELWLYKKQTVTRYGYKLNADDTYHRVSKFVAADNGDHTFEVKECGFYYFAISKYANRTGRELCDIVRTDAVSPSSSKEYTMGRDSNPTITNTNSPNGVDTFHIYKGQKYTENHYF